MNFSGDHSGSAAVVAKSAQFPSGSSPRKKPLSSIAENSNRNRETAQRKLSRSANLPYRPAAGRDNHRAKKDAHGPESSSLPGGPGGVKAQKSRD
jgi:hypothetical protein